MAHDLVIRGGTVIDGSGLGAFRGDVAVDNGTIVAVGPVLEKGREEVDATGLVVAPGFIDMHVHLREPGQAAKETIATGTAASVSTAASRSAMVGAPDACASRASMAK